MMRSLMVLALVLTIMAPRALSESLPDSCFLVEEAWHSDAAVIQHSIGFADDTWGYAWTQEWASAETQHLFGYSIPVDLNGSDGADLGSVSFDYRFQTSLGPFAAGPRLSVALPAGKNLNEPDALRYAIEAALPLSFAHSDQRASHWNIRIGWSELEDGAEQEIAAGAAFVQALGIRSAAVMEAEIRNLRTSGDLVEEERSTEITISPGLRHAFGSLSDLGITPGISLPITFTEDDQSIGIVFHAMFEHSLPGRND